jgi:hypothetical protein
MGTGEAPAGTVHGLRGYDRGCRCDACRSAGRGRMRKWQARKAAERVPGPDGRLVAPNARHGEYASYVNYGCRCVECTAANAAIARARYRAAKAAR